MSNVHPQCGHCGEGLYVWDRKPAMLQAREGNDTSRITVRPLGGTIGAEIFDVDVAGELDGETIAEIRRALLDHLVVFFRDQELDVRSVICKLSF